MKRPPDLTWRTGSDGRLIDVSDPWLAFVGRSKEDLIRNWLDVIEPRDRHRVVEEVTRHMQVRTRYVIYYRVLAADGGTEWVRTAARPLPDGGYAGVNRRSRRCAHPPDAPRLLKIVEHASKMARASVG